MDTSTEKTSTKKSIPGNAGPAAAGTPAASAAKWLLPLLLAVAIMPAHGQKLLDRLKALGHDAGQEYLDPVASTFGAAMSSGWFHRAPDKQRLGLDFDIGLVSVGGLFLGAPTHFTSSGTFNFNRLQTAQVVDSLFNLIQENPKVAALSPSERQALKDSLSSRISGQDIQVTFRGPTAIGPKNDSLFVTFQDISVPISVPATSTTPAFDTTIVIGPNERIAVPAGGALEGLPFLPILAPSLTVGTVYGTMATLRWLPKVKVTSDLGKVGLFGFGLQHNVSYWMGPEAFMDITLDAHGQWLEVENTFTSHAYAGGATLSKKFGFGTFGITPFAGAALEESKIYAEYTASFDNPLGGSLDRTIKYTLDGENSAHYTLGVALEFFHVNLTTDYNFASYGSVSASLMVLL